MVGRNVISRLNRSNTVLFVCDIQERFRPLIHNMPRVIRQTKLLFDATRVMVCLPLSGFQCPKFSSYSYCHPAFIRIFNFVIICRIFRALSPNKTPRLWAELFQSYCRWTIMSTQLCLRRNSFPCGLQKSETTYLHLLM